MAEEAWLGLANKTVAVTGAASGIGAAIAWEFARQGARVALLDANAAPLQTMQAAMREQGFTVCAIACDVSQEAATLAAAQTSMEQLCPCYALINNAGILKPGSLKTVSIADWNQVLSVNLTGYLLCARAFYEQLLASKGALVHIASISGSFPQTASGAYSAAKAGVLLLSRQMAAEWGPLGLRSNAICPGMIRTALSAKFYENPEFEARRSALTANRRIGEPDDIANAALFLASPRAAYVNAAQLDVDGGMSSMLMDMVPRPGYNQTVGKNS